MHVRLEFLIFMNFILDIMGRWYDNEWIFWQIRLRKPKVYWR